MTYRVDSPTLRFDGRAAKRLRLRAGLKSEAVAMATDRTKESVINWELGRAIPRGDIVAKLCALYGCSIADLFIESDDDDRHWIEQAAIESRRSQGLPDGIEDDEAIDDLVELLRPS